MDGQETLLLRQVGTGAGAGMDRGMNRQVFVSTKMGLPYAIVVSTVSGGAVEFEWDEGKAASNIAKHGVPFAIVREFDWTTAEVEIDDRFDYGEERLVAYGHTSDGHGYVIVFVLRHEVCRIVTVRRFTSREIKIYGY